MQIIKEKIIKGKPAKLVLCDDNITLNVLYDSICIWSNTNNAWKNLKEGNLEEAYLELAVDYYINKNKHNEEFENKLRELGW